MRIALVCVASVVLAACSLVEPKATALEVTTEISPTSFRVGQQVMVSIITRNNGFRTQTFGIGGCPYPFDVFDSQGRAISWQPVNCSLMATMKTLKPGESYVQYIPWTGNGFTDGSAPRKLAPGSYSIRTGWSDDQADVHSGAFQIVN